MDPGGVKRFIYALLNAWPQVSDDLPVLVHNEPEVLNLFPRFEQVYIPVRHKLAFDYLWSTRHLLRLKPSLVLYPKNVIPPVHFLLPFKKVNVIHDLAYFEPSLKAYPWKDTLFMRTFIPMSCKAASRILAVSEFTKEDIIARFGIKRDRVGAITEGVESGFGVPRDTGCLDRLAVERPFFLYAGSLSPRKNLQRLLAAVTPVLMDRNLDLIITGLKSWGDNSFLESYIQRSKGRIRVLGFIDEEELIELYQKAKGFLFPSLYEGFGLPILEAQLARCPVLTSVQTVCPETSGGLAVHVDAYDVEDIRRGVLELLETDEALLDRAEEHARKYSWENAVEVLQGQLKLIA